jgi:hypothetical protein
MDLAEADRRIRSLERRYHELHRMGKTTLARTTCGESNAAAESRERPISSEELASEKRAILREIEMIEDSLLD